MCDVCVCVRVGGRGEGEVKTRDIIATRIPVLERSHSEHDWIMSRSAVSVRPREMKVCDLPARQTEACRQMLGVASCPE